METITLDQAIDTVMQLSIEQREMLIEIIRSRDIEARRKEMAEEARESIAAYRAGEFKSQPLEEILDDLRNSLNDPDTVFN
ncbi:MAG: hypothetical protein Kow0031_23490 [Anaerolineae bacterium]